MEVEEEEAHPARRSYAEAETSARLACPSLHTLDLDLLRVLVVALVQDIQIPDRDIHLPGLDIHPPVH